MILETYCVIAGIHLGMFHTFKMATNQISHKPVKVEVWDIAAFDNYNNIVRADFTRYSQARDWLEEVCEDTLLGLNGADDDKRSERDIE